MVVRGLVPILGIAAVAVLQPHAIALSSSEVARLARRVTVQIESQTPGSGVIIQREGNTYTLLTAAHVVATEDNYEALTSDGQRHTIKNQTIRRFTDVDLAVVQFTSDRNYPLVKVGQSSRIKAGSVSYVSGFPLKSLDVFDTTYRLTKGHIGANAQRSLAQGYAMAYSNDTFSGMSGGPVLNEQGQLIGIHGRSLTVRQETGGLDPDSGIKLGFNLAIPINAFLKKASQVTPALAVKTIPTNFDTAADDAYLQGVDQFVKRDYQKALASFNRAIQLRPNYGEAYFQRGNLFLSRGKREVAIANYDKAIKFQPTLAGAYNIRGFLRLGTRNISGAIADLNQAIRHRPDFAPAYHFRGQAKSRLGDRQDAISDFNQAIRLQPNYAQAYNNRAIERVEGGDMKGGLSDFTQAIRIKPNYGDAYYNRGQVRERLGDSQGALADFDKALQFNQSSSSAGS